MKAIFRRALLALLLLAPEALSCQQRVKVTHLSMSDPRARQAALAVDLILSGSKTATEAFLAEFGTGELQTSPTRRADLDELVQKLSKAPVSVIGVYRISGGRDRSLLVRLTGGKFTMPYAVLVQMEDEKSGRISGIRAVQVSEA